MQAEVQGKAQGLVEQIATRRALRALDTRPIPKEVLGRIMSAATFAPSCSNNQPWRFVVADEEPVLSRVKEALTGGNYWAKKAPAIVVVATRPDLDAQLSDNRDYALFDVGQAVFSRQVQAVAEGLIVHPIAGFDPLVVKKNLEIPDEYTVITLVNMGYPGDESHLSDKHKAQEHSERNRKPESEVISYNRWFAGA